MWFRLTEIWFKIKTNIVALESEVRYFECEFNLSHTKQFSLSVPASTELFNEAVSSECWFEPFLFFVFYEVSKLSFYI